MFGGYDSNVVGATKSAKFFVQRGRIWEGDVSVNYTVMAAVALTSKTDASEQVTSTTAGATPNGVMCTVLPHLICFIFCCLLNFWGS